MLSVNFQWIQWKHEKYKKEKYIVLIHIFYYTDIEV